MPTVEPSSTTISLNTPATGEGISASTLSVEISNSGSSFWTSSPAFLSHLVIVPSKIDSPICGMTTSVPAVAAAAGAGGAGFAGAGGAFFVAGAGVAAGAGADFASEAGVTVAPASLTTATTVLICTVAPSATLISVSTPATGEGISASTLSVEISKSGSSFCTVSPAFLNHLVMVPSKIDSPIWGMITSVGMNRFLRDAARSSGQSLPDYKSRNVRLSCPCRMFGIAVQPLDFRRNGERRVFRGKLMGRGGLRAQGVQAVDGENLLAENLSEVARSLMGDGFEIRQAI